ncbi:MAG: hypothetical protein K8F92_06320 [Hyphomicrobium sp.]|uniref:hypothetical protein n=1 Tax=Hyphomicrobium sp. TaxID=82 RepID=UPI00132AAAE7|nr:hypothetical protein [Hyphomicrobium sp.]KAB2942308.1 MAG: hypothetical protein F9K20_07165 [Hyphomicrobium sp.]MBZ0209249.1 hypothetical protein [Hyphomicrobium sp.]
MRSWQRFVATLFLTILVPASVLGAPLVYCVSAGHRAVELPCISTNTTLISASEVDGAEGSGCGLCLDLKIVPTGHIEQAPSAKLAIGLVDNSPQANCPPMPTSRQPWAWARSRAKRVSDHLVANDQLAALRTVVLLN